MVGARRIVRLAENGLTSLSFFTCMNNHYLDDAMAMAASLDMVMVC